MNWRRKLLRMLAGARRDIAGSMRSPKPFLIISFAVLLVAIGQIGLVIPIFPGLLFTIPGLLLLSLYSPTVYATLKRRLANHPKLESFTDRGRNWLINRIKPRK